MRVLEANPGMSQRDLARKLGISLGKANYCLQALIRKGWIKARNFKNSQNKAAYMYLLTPRGLEMKGVSRCDTCRSRCGSLRRCASRSSRCAGRLCASAHLTGVPLDAALAFAGVDGRNCG